METKDVFTAVIALLIGLLVYVANDIKRHMLERQFETTDQYEYFMLRPVEDIYKVDTVGTSFVIHSAKSINQ